MSLNGIAGGVEVILVLAFFIIGYVIYLANKSESDMSDKFTQSNKKDISVK